MAGKTKVDSARDKHEEDLREIQENNAHRRLHQNVGPDEVHTDVFVTGEDKDGEPTSDKKGEVHVFGGKAYVQVDAEFDADDLLVFSNLIAKASQAVQV